ncbi:MAG TPA: histidine--tRNA ligase [Myxococcota bacterium]|nr:histidine--tRNA ligase [Myxococcota bacterium]
MERIQVIRGMRDIFPEQARWWRRMESQLAAFLDLYGYGEIRTPLIEQTGLFKRSIGEQTDIVEKEMYTFTDRDGASLTLRPEGTASVIRSYIETSLWQTEPVSRLFYLGPMFRHERPQKGRYRQFSQLGVELIGAAQPAADVEMIDIMVNGMAAIGLIDTSLELNSMGCPLCRPAYREKLITYLEEHAENLCQDCRRRMKTNPLRVLDCKVEGCKQIAGQAPRMLDSLCTECAEHFALVRRGIESIEIPYNLNHRMVRGLDYYSRTTFELLAPGLGSQNAVAGGGRYDGLVEHLGGPSIPAVGFAAGLDRILLRLLETIANPQRQQPVFVVSRGEQAWLSGLGVLRALRSAGISAESDARQGSMKAQMKRADKAGARFVILLGEDEIERGVLTIKDMAAAADSPDKQFEIQTGNVVEELVSRLAADATREAPQ